MASTRLSPSTCTLSMTRTWARTHTTSAVAQSHIYPCAAQCPFSHQCLLDDLLMFKFAVTKHYQTVGCQITTFLSRQQMQFAPGSCSIYCFHSFFLKTKKRGGPCWKVNDRPGDLSTPLPCHCCCQYCQWHTQCAMQVVCKCVCATVCVCLCLSVFLYVCVRVYKSRRRM